ncbi:staphylococcal-like nuclease CAN1 [Helianthus annuus]|uniref:staphylococcal-like nuclease CAN1 n=1 Tax=Helianthus annuus TaxID=4232 RepID=UPI000B8FF078|nr:staphylococcal-like nuclease CAN1 [Helianthus annuus]
MEGFLHFYGLPHYSLVIKPSPYDEPSWVTPLAPAPPVWERKPVFKLSTLPVRRNFCNIHSFFKPRFFISFANQVLGERVTNGVVFSVSVEVKDFYLLPQEILFAVSERRKAQATGDNDRAREMMHKINATQDYEVLYLDDEGYLAKKYEIKLRGVCAPMNGRSGRKVRRELEMLVDGKCLTISVYNLDEEKRCVAEVYSDHKHLQGILLNNATEVPWGWKAEC